MLANSKEIGTLFLTPRAIYSRKVHRQRRALLSRNFKESKTLKKHCPYNEDITKLRLREIWEIIQRNELNRQRELKGLKQILFHRPHIIEVRLKKIEKILLFNNLITEYKLNEVKDVLSDNGERKTEDIFKVIKTNLLSNPGIKKILLNELEDIILGDELNIEYMLNVLKKFLLSNTSVGLSMLNELEKILLSNELLDEVKLNELRRILLSDNPVSESQLDELKLLLVDILHGYSQPKCYLQKENVHLNKCNVKWKYHPTEKETHANEIDRTEQNELLKKKNSLNKSDSSGGEDMPRKKNRNRDKSIIEQRNVNVFQKEKKGSINVCMRDMTSKNDLEYKDNSPKEGELPKKEKKRIRDRSTDGKRDKKVLPNEEDSAKDIYITDKTEKNCFKERDDSQKEGELPKKKKKRIRDRSTGGKGDKNVLPNEEDSAKDIYITDRKEKNCFKERDDSQKEGELPKKKKKRIRDRSTDGKSDKKVLPKEEDPAKDTYITEKTEKDYSTERGIQFKEEQSQKKKIYSIYKNMDKKREKDELQIDKDSAKDAHIEDRKDEEKLLKKKDSLHVIDVTVRDSLYDITEEALFKTILEGKVKEKTGNIMHIIKKVVSYGIPLTTALISLIILSIEFIKAKSASILLEATAAGMVSGAAALASCSPEVATVATGCALDTVTTFFSGPFSIGNLVTSLSAGSKCAVKTAVAATACTASSTSTAISSSTSVATSYIVIQALFPSLISITVVVIIVVFYNLFIYLDKRDKLNFLYKYRRRVRRFLNKIKRGIMD
ncbi:Plasmodium exported protein, unknown function [Plasmodium ovale wallikeri]|uniref:Uncharacterized protein n=1 Tax=Plasmodium ovale wallikeri TaxID=864142 RepID=A0A1A9AKU2_PLAOA|nr:Plasmodium exported protein, unknown function [Plasmodium ovale wallikeri]SBT57245.1 Plasmodium exported protein, unknown function [Plasmodium ovale wallikeri]